MSIPTPIKEIGCQDLIGKTKTKEHGFLRRRTKINGYVDSLFAKKWSTNYVVIYDGCIYCYADESKTFYSKARSLYGFDGCSECTMGECGNNNIPWVFKAHNALNHKKSFFFAAVSKNEMKKWIESIQDVIFSVNSLIRTIGNLPKHPLISRDSKTSINSDDSDSDYEDVIETSTYTASPKNGTIKNPPTRALPKTPGKSARYLNTCTLPKQYTQPKSPNPSRPPNSSKPTNYFKPNTSPKPKPVSKSTKTNTHLPILPPKPHLKPATRTNAVKFQCTEVNTPIAYELNETKGFWDGFIKPKGFWEGNLGEENDLLANKIPGTFLIRKSTSMNHPLTLLVKWNSNPKKYHICKTNGYYHLQDKSESERFLSVDLLIRHYKVHNLASKPETIILANPFNHPNSSCD